jgi:hypothetical protein
MVLILDTNQINHGKISSGIVYFFKKLNKLELFNSIGYNKNSLY